MSGSAAESLKTEIAHVLTMDVIGYSKLLIDRQTELMSELNAIVRNSSHFQKADDAGRLIRLPTGDGMALVFFGETEAPLQCAIEIARALKSEADIAVRMGIHSGPVSKIVDLNGQPNVAGAGIDMAQRVMDCGDAGHILLSQRAADDLAPFARWNPHLHGIGECEVKHGRKISLVNFFTDEIGNPARPSRCSGVEPVSPARSTSTIAPRMSMRPALAALLVIFAAIGCWFWWRHSQETPTAQNLGANQKSIAVLPFENLSHDPDNAYFADGIQEEILTRLSKIADLKVISRPSTQRYKSAPSNLRDIAHQLGVAHILEGSIQKAADQVRVNVQLINAETDSHVWADKYDRKLTDIFAVESDIAAKIAETLQAKLSSDEQHAIARRPTENTEAHQAYLKGQYYWYKYPAPGFEKSREYFQQAIDLDPTYAPGYAGLAYFYGFAAAQDVMPPDESWPKSEAAANKALSLDDSLADAYNAFAAIQLYYHRDWAAAANFFRRGIERNPNSAEIRHHYAFCLILFGRSEEALAEMNRSLELDPLALRNNLDRAKMFFFLRQFDQAIAQCRKTLELENFAAGHEWLGNVYAQKGMLGEAVNEWRTALALDGEEEVAAKVEQVSANSGPDAAAAALAQHQLEKLAEKAKRGEYVSAEKHMRAYLQLRDNENAFAWLAKAVAEHTRFALTIKVDPALDPLRGDPRFERLAAQVKIGK